ncbi:MAG: DUF4432 family protein [Telmatospirillum sp.]|nr:DUF4432 family protein [Telmatospirillum sp.]
MMRITLDRSMFPAGERDLVKARGLSVRAFRFKSGVEGLRIEGRRATLVLLPFRGQQVWSFELDGRSCAMRSMVTEPAAEPGFLESFGAFFVHCGLMAMGAPGPQDAHPLHGEFPSAPMDEAWLEIEELPGDSLVRVGGRYDHAVMFRGHYRAEPWVLLRSSATVFEVGMTLVNRAASPMPFMYLGHANFRPVDGGRLVYSAPYTPDAVRVRRSIPSHVTPAAGYPDLIAALAREPSVHHRLEPGLRFDPEVVFMVDYLADAQGWAHSLQIHPDGTADWIAHRPDQCPRAIRWLSRTPDQDCLALVEPATSGVEGYLEERAAGRVPILAPGATWTAVMRMGRLTATAALVLERKADGIAGRNAPPWPGEAGCAGSETAGAMRRDREL